MHSCETPRQMPSGSSGRTSPSTSSTGTRNLSLDGETYGTAFFGPKSVLPPLSRFLASMELKSSYSTSRATHAPWVSQ